MMPTNNALERAVILRGRHVLAGPEWASCPSAELGRHTS
jgi:hypothetical protein